MGQNNRLPGEREPANPFAPPEADLSPARVPFRLTGVHGNEPFSASVAIGRSWELYTQRFSLVFGTVGAALMINVLYRLAGQEMASSSDTSSAMGLLAQFAFLSAGIVLEVWLSTGQAMVLLRVAREEAADFRDLFDVGPYVLRNVVATLLFYLAWAAAAVVCLAPAWLIYVTNPSGSFGAFWAALVLGVSSTLGLCLVLSARLNQYTYLIIDQDAGAVESLKASYELTRGHSVELIGLLLVGRIVGLLGLLACLVGIFLTIPWSVQLSACTYVGLTGGVPVSAIPVPSRREPDGYL